MQDIYRAVNASQKSTKTTDRQVNTQTCRDSRQEEEPGKPRNRQKKKKSDRKTDRHTGRKTNQTDRLTVRTEKPGQQAGR